MDEKPIALQIEYEWPAVLPQPLSLFLEYWRGCRRVSGRPPFRADVDPLDMPHSLLPGLGIIEASRWPNGHRRYRYRLLGTDHYAANGKEHTGLYFDEIHPPEELALIEPLYERLLAGAEPHYWRRPSADPSRRHTGYSRILAPLLNEAGEGSYLLGYWLWEHLFHGPA